MPVDATIAECIHLIRARYLDMPGLRLTKSQVRRLWRLDSGTCDALLDALTDIRFLRLTDEGAYEREGLD